MTNYQELYEKWLNSPALTEEEKLQLKSVEADEVEKEDRFYKELEFGTAGLRGKVGMGSNRMNRFIIARATKALAQTIIDNGLQEKGIAIAHDPRLFSKEFAKLAALVMASNGVKAYLFEDLRPTPELSFAVRYLGTASGINITASHNPKEYNGYKVYWQEGSQIKSDISDKVLEYINSMDIFEEYVTLTEEEALEKGLLVYIGEKVDEEFYKESLNCTINDENIDKDIKVVYTPLNGVGNLPVREVLKRRGFENIFVVKEQELPDPEFTTVGYPNPEVPKAFLYSEKLGKEVGADILIATDPDCDRVALEVKDKNGEYVFLNGNRIGALLSYYIFSQRHALNNLPENPVLVKSIVTGDLSRAIAKKYGIETVETLTGFKNICGKTNEYDVTKEKNYVFGYEESIGFCYGTFVRDKDAVGASMMVVEMAAYYKKQGKSLLDVLNDIYEEFGYYNERQISLELEGIEGQQRIGRMMEDFRENPIKEMGDISLKEIIDFKDGYLDFPKQNCLKYYLNDGSWYALRPSGTEPKIKLYIYTIGKTEQESIDKLDLIEKACREKMNNVK